MNTEPNYLLVDRYLDGVATGPETDAIAAAVESDPDLLAYLCESAEIEAGLHRNLEPGAAARLLIRPVWH